MPRKRPAPVSAGDVLAGKYRVERVIGAGGMGVVVAARHLQLDQTVALKLLTRPAPAACERFSREARAAACLKSEHAAKVHDVGTLENGSPYMVMDYLEGSDLDALVSDQGALPIDHAVGYVIQACEAIGEAHAHGIVHRDIKPQNLFLTTGPGGRPSIKVLDFGISKTQNGEKTLTRTSEIMGTPVYMAPEQLRSTKNVDARADIWALGAMLYELVTGRMPFEAANVAQLRSMILSQSPRLPSELRTEIPAPLNDAILRCLERDPARRFPGVSELVGALEPFAPAWAAIDRALWVPSVAPSVRPVIVSPLANGKMSPPGSETALLPATPRRPRQKSSVVIGVAVAAATAIGVIGTVGFLRGRPTATQSPEEDPVTAAATPAEPPPPASAPPVTVPAMPPAPLAPPVAVVADPAAVPPATPSGHPSRATSRPASEPRPRARADDAYDHR
jgi:serine/threonine-protein kinase